MGKLRTLNRDNILPIGDLVRIVDDEQDAPLPVTRPVTWTQRKSVSHKSHRLRKPDRYLVDEDASSEPHDSRMFLREAGTRLYQ